MNTNAVETPTAAPLPLADIQGIILRGYNFQAVRHFILRISQPAAARRLAGRLASGPAPRVSSAADWGPVPPTYRIDSASPVHAKKEAHDA